MFCDLYFVNFSKLIIGSQFGFETVVSLFGRLITTLYYKVLSGTFFAQAVTGCLCSRCDFSRARSYSLLWAQFGTYFVLRMAQIDAYCLQAVTVFGLNQQQLHPLILHV